MGTFSVNEYRRALQLEENAPQCAADLWCAETFGLDNKNAEPSVISPVSEVILESSEAKADN